MAATYEFPQDRAHFTWDVGNEPVLTIQSGDSVVYETRDVSDNQITPDSTADVIPELDWDRVYPLSGPVLVEGAEPGDTLAIEILAMETRGWGYALIIPGLGLLPEEFPDPYIRVFDLSDGEFAYLRDDVAIPIEPFFGTKGVCPAGAKEQAIMPPGRFGGNMDTRQLVQGTTLYLPVEVDGGLFSCGDAHAAQGDGEVCVTGIETPMHGSSASRSKKGGKFLRRST
jgi:acetamidase/formamidase